MGIFGGVIFIIAFISFLSISFFTSTSSAADYIRSIEGPLKTISITPVIIPVYEDINDTFGEVDKVNLAGKLYLLLYDTDIDIMFLTRGSKSARYGVDFSRNITTNFEIQNIRLNGVYPSIL